MIFSVEAINGAAKKIEGAIRRTPILRSEAFERKIGSKFPIYFKLENLQLTGSFKSRGALNKLLSLTADERKRGVITASAGNHAQGVAYHAHRLGIQAKIIMPVPTPLIKINATKQWGAEILLFGESYQEAYDKAVELQKLENRVYVHAFDDSLIMAGQGTVAKEVLEDCPDIQVFVCPIGGGGLIAGCATYLKERNSDLKVVGVQAEGCSTFLPSLEAKKPVTIAVANTIAEGMSAKRMGDITFDICKRMVNEIVLVSDESIAEGVLWLLENERLFVEGCGGATVAAIVKKPELVTGPTVVVLSGGNLDVNLLARIIERGLVKTGRLVRLELTVLDAPGALHKLLGIFAEERASIVHVSHERLFGKSSLRQVLVRVTLETNGQEHDEAIRKALLSKGYQATFLT